MATKRESELVSNRQASHHYEILDRFEGGLLLKGTEVKSLRDHEASLQESYIKVKNNELWLVGAYIAPYKQGSLLNHTEKRDRKILMHKREIMRLKAKVAEKGLALVPLSLYLNKGIIKILIGLGKGRKAYDKRQQLKTKDVKRSIQRELREI